jgi:hypothetical protein
MNINLGAGAFKQSTTDYNAPNDIFNYALGIKARSLVLTEVPTNNNTNSVVIEEIETKTQENNDVPEVVLINESS